MLQQNVDITSPDNLWRAVQALPYAQKEAMLDNLRKSLACDRLDHLIDSLDVQVDDALQADIYRAVEESRQELYDERVRYGQGCY